MVKTTIRKDLSKLKDPLVNLYLFESSKSCENDKVLDKALRQKISIAISEFSFKAKYKETLLLEGDANFRRVLLVGLGAKKEFSADKARTAAFTAASQANLLKVASMTVINPEESGLLKEIIEGLRFANYRFEGMHQKPEKDEELTLKCINLITANTSAAKIDKELTIVFTNVFQARDMTNLPANVVTPTYFEDRAKEIAKTNKKVTLKVISVDEAKKLKMGAFLGVAKGAKEPAKMIILTYLGGEKKDHLYAIVGKGITFDSGGISLKQAKGMEGMKGDMAGAAATLGAFKSVVELGLSVNLMAVIAATENMPDGGAYRPGDILTASNGKTIEVISTDAEGRLVLANALVYAQKNGADRIIDMATLTGACITTFGDVHTALMSNNSNWSKKYLEASRVTGEKTWELPMDAEYGEMMKSDTGDMMNVSSGGKAGTITGGKFLENFVESKTQWIHLDIASTAYMDNPRNYLRKNATGVPIRTLVELFKAEEK